MDSTPRDDNGQVAIHGQDSTDSTKTASIAVNPVTNAVIVQIA